MKENSKTAEKRNEKGIKKQTLRTLCVIDIMAARGTPGPQPFRAVGFRVRIFRFDLRSGCRSHKTYE